MPKNISSTLSEEEQAARRSNRRTLVGILVLVFVVGVLPLLVVLVDKIT